MPGCPGAYLTRPSRCTRGSGFPAASVCVRALFASPRYKLIYYMNSYPPRNASASRAAQTGTQGAELGYASHGGIRPSEVCRTPELEPNQGSLASENYACTSEGCNRSLEAPRVRHRRVDGGDVV